MAERDNTAYYLVGAAVAAFGLLMLAGATTAAVVATTAAPAVVYAVWSTSSRTSLQRMTDEQKAFMDRLRVAVPAYIPLTISSSFRTPEEQASAMRSKLAEGSTYQKLRDLYGNSAAINEVLAAPPDTWADVIQAQVDRGTYLSRHLRHDALDLRVKLPGTDIEMARAWQDIIVAAAQNLGAGRAFVEHEPDHIHLERLGPPASSAPVTSGVLRLGAARVARIGAASPTYGPPAKGDWSGPAQATLKNTVWRYIDFLRLYRGLSDASYRDAHNALGGADSALIDQTVIDFNDEVDQEARSRGTPRREVIAEFKARAAQEGLPSATGRPPVFA